jgi:hypothetical protein
MAENQNAETVEKIAATSSTKAATAPESAEKPWLFGQTPSMWFLIDTAVVLLIVLIMRALA